MEAFICCELGGRGHIWRSSGLRPLTLLGHERERAARGLGWRLRTHRPDHQAANRTVMLQTVPAA